MLRVLLDFLQTFEDRGEIFDKNRGFYTILRGFNNFTTERLRDGGKERWRLKLGARA
jgi:hypothetical protein